MPEWRPNSLQQSSTKYVYRNGKVHHITNFIVHLAASGLSPVGLVDITHHNASWFFNGKKAYCILLIEHLIYQKKKKNHIRNHLCLHFCFLFKTYMCSILTRHKTFLYYSSIQSQAYIVYVSKPGTYCYI